LADLLAERLTAQLLAGPPAASVVDVVRRLLAVHAQDPRGARLAIRARSTGLSARDVDHALTVDRSLVISSLNRGTLHLVGSEDYWWLRDLTTPQLMTGVMRGLATEQISADDADRAVEAIERALAEHGPMTREPLREQVAATGVATAGPRLTRLIFLAAIRGLILRGPMVGANQAFVRVADWLGPPPAAPQRSVALGELARRFLAAHGPASDADLAKWAGITLGDARRGLTAISSRLVERDDRLAAVVDRSEPAELPPPKLLGSFDPSLFGWVSREPIIGDHEGIVTSNGIFRAFAMVDGRAVALWTLTNGAVVISPDQPIPATVSAALDADAADVLRFVA
jgi:hypothetical protein